LEILKTVEATHKNTEGGMEASHKSTATGKIQTKRLKQPAITKKRNGTTNKNKIQRNGYNSQQQKRGMETTNKKGKE
jgi:hypothetical protein